MFLDSVRIDPSSSVQEIVSAHYGTAAIFRKYDIEYCCGARWPLETVCLMKGVELEGLLRELKDAIRTIELPRNLPYENWSIDFLTEYIINIHHQYVHQTVPDLGQALGDFAEEHSKNYPVYAAVRSHYRTLEEGIYPSMAQEENVIFPYLRQVADAFTRKDPIAGLFIKTLRKPVEKVMNNERDMLINAVTGFRKLTNNYEIPPKACTSHGVVLARLKALDNELMQHVRLEHQILLPRVIEMEKQLLNT